MHNISYIEVLKGVSPACCGTCLPSSGRTNMPVLKLISTGKLLLQGLSVCSNLFVC